MVTTRAPKKRAASPAIDDADGALPQKRPSRAKKAPPAPPASDENEDDDDELMQQQAPPKKRGRAPGKAKDSPVDDDDEDVPPKKPATKGKGKAKASDTKDEDEVTPETFKAVPKYERTKKAVADGQYAKVDNLVVPVDEACSLSSAGWRVYIDDNDGIIYDASLNQTNSSGNNNKFYKVQILTDGRNFRTWTRWGRVGATGQSAQLGDGSLGSAMKEFEKKFKDKAALTWANRGAAPKPGKYVFLEKDYQESEEDEEPEELAGPSTQKAGRSRSSSPVKSKLNPRVASLLELIFNQEHMDSVMADMNYDVKKMPLGKLSKATITRGYNQLKLLNDLFDDPSLATDLHGMNSVAEATEHLSNLYYSYIPHNFGRNRAPVISNHQRLKNEIILLESLTDLKDADSIIKAGNDTNSVHVLDSQFQSLGLQETTPIDRATDEFSHISDYLINSRGSTHGHEYKLIDVFRIERQGENDRFERSHSKRTASDRRLLWHGSRSTNYGGILSQGLRIAPPEAPVSGYMFGKGIYLADMASKSANYCNSYASGGHALLLLCEAELGDPMQELVDASYDAGNDALAKGLLSTWGQGAVGPALWKDASCVHPSLAGVQMPDTVTKPPGDTTVLDACLEYNEYICYNVDQVRLRYLLRVKM
ncbi:poly polymerase 2 adp-ribosyltransferase 2 like protein [Zymoseptoria brevis]|uniref:Poly [ADP-ribose] polymerase n=1 Tax=Zymoseptoria brevis TaxID=1047168 RepID=A0A0F4G758_9PEZI|nr:poly polymerase 2 adp-ribosyltransferase 2 like protein [Zymoseptoria brevis]